jgi:hypothetical protein
VRCAAHADIPFIHLPQIQLYYMLMHTTSNDSITSLQYIRRLFDFRCSEDGQKKGCQDLALGNTILAVVGTTPRIIDILIVESNKGIGQCDSHEFLTHILAISLSSPLPSRGERWSLQKEKRVRPVTPRVQRSPGMSSPLSERIKLRPLSLKHKIAQLENGRGGVNRF